MSIINKIFRKRKENKKVNKNSFTKIALAKGEMNVYDFGSVKLHAYKTNDFIEDEVFFFEKSGRVVALEAPCFYDNYDEIIQ